jgi:Uncharacterized protein conserved in archaea
MRIEVTVEIRNTEDERKVMNALSNVFSYSKISKVNNLGRTFLIAESNNLLSLEKISNLIKNSRIELSARSILQKSIKNGVMKFSLNKQAAYMNRISFCTVENESALGPIDFRIICEDYQRLIDFLAPLPKKIISKQNRRDHKQEMY